MPFQDDGVLMPTADVAFELRFSRRDIAKWASRFSYESDIEIEQVGSTARARGYLTRSEFVKLCRWKSPRSHPLVRANPTDVVEAVTGAALGTTDERAKMGLLRALSGVSWPTASVILHFCDRERYPILDFRALWSLGYRTPPPYTLQFWLAYVKFTRDLAKRTRSSMRQVDRALWQYSKERQRT